MTGAGLEFDAIEFAARAHRGQYRKGTQIPYILHPLRVAQLLITMGAPRRVVVAAILHDTIEDTDATAEQIAAAFGADVAALVEEASEPDQEAVWEERKQHTITSVRTASADALLVICADKLDNVRSMRRGERRDGAAFWDRFQKTRPSQAWYYQRLAMALAEVADDDPLLSLTKRLKREVDSLFAPPETAPDATARRSGGDRRRR